MRDSRLEANTRLMATAPDLLSSLRNVCYMAREVESCWESGDLAGAVRALAFERKIAETALEMASPTNPEVK